MIQEKNDKGRLEKEKSTIYSHTLHYRYRWKPSMMILQALLIFFLLFVAERYFNATSQHLLYSFGYFIIIWILQGISFFLYCFVSSLPMCWHIDGFLSPWGGWRTKLPLSISNYQQIEWMFFSIGTAVSLLVTAWWSVQYGFLMLSYHITLSIPRIVTVLRIQKWKNEKKSYVIKYERQGIGLYST
ncbi:hypothetical protein SAMN04489735_10352 [Aneurinibacillus thermoaerophilus]|uniref:Uncharacterized protein n=1 Tax=Aneurinibacillus thermoaerophilus TaxID=143495 RepID=A0A1G8DP45_ANETH|nr:MULTISPECIES: hypothetical protein [Aneurinibacillus]AMA74545.1 hypothetical protein ACH33_18380 [Aneurinibacillus sp. XH2]MED0675170.1 hypothetical protein [Aneurinibacillus thermoaerophilus]MED0681220.1 hypothetical protein [Aneurinibacillus thermoaerophilus]MED0765442.1 hypothetical protein [Aneurinibacillus thermoaerophilus]QYY42877.1 hypothetical protein K3F53_00425 [Aneurinibacillus thermoaerophilus]